ncbi:MAG TPA: TorF family putative porin [Sphingobium sp.]|uniref:TorF family putative porin n=1 Tax=Sphingobium sp. TaxID=1912891 RepID=UPI002ED4F8F1
MRKSMIGLSAIALFAAATPAFADAPADDGLGLAITGGASVVSDYRFRGISQSNKDFAIQGSVTVTHTSGAYVGFWGSSNQGQGEIDVIGGFSHQLIPGLTGDIGVTYYLYPNRRGDGTPGAGFTNGLRGSNELVEPYVDLSTTVGPVTGKVGFAWAPKQDYFASVTPGELGKRSDNTYLWGDASVGIPNTPLKLTGHVGWTSNHYLRGVYTDGITSRADVIDFGVGASASYKALTFGVNFVTTDLPSRFTTFDYNGNLVGARSYLGADNTVVFSVGASF